jgi:hypothetical protein
MYENRIMKLFKNWFKRWGGTRKRNRGCELDQNALYSYMDRSQ